MNINITYRGRTSMQSRLYKDEMKALPDRWRDRISKANVLDRLLKHFNNELADPLDTGQITLGIKLISKVLPDLQSTTVEHRIDHSSLSIHELNGRLSALGYDPQQVWNRLNGKAINNLAAIEHDDVPVDTDTDTPGSTK